MDSSSEYSLYIYHAKWCVGPIQRLREALNSVLPSDPLILIGGTAAVCYFIYEIANSVPKDGMRAGIKRVVFRAARNIPSIRKQIEEEMGKAEKSLEEDIKHLFTPKSGGDPEYLLRLPTHGMSNDAIIKKIQEYMTLGKYSWEEGWVSGAVYHGGKELTELNTKVFGLTTWTNPLHPDLFPGVNKMEAEIIRMTANLFHGNNESVGTVTSGGTESIILAVKAYRDYAVNERGIRKPEILVPITAHAAFDKAAELLNIKIRHVDIDKKTMKVRVDYMEKMINGNTCMLVGSAPGFPHGIIDDIEKIANLGLKYKIPVHVDACLGGFLLVFMPEAGYVVPPFDFKVPGVTSISADTHKYGFTPKGTSVLLFSHKKYRHQQYFCQPNWPGGIYASPTIAGSRPGVTIAGCWSSMLHFGLDGYRSTTRKIIDATRAIEIGLRAIPELEVMGEPQVSVIAFCSEKIDVYELVQRLNEKGWNLNNLQFPASVHICVTYLHTMDGVVEKFLRDVRSIVEVLKNCPKKNSEGSAALYASSQQIPDRSLISDITRMYIDNIYRTDFGSEVVTENGNCGDNGNPAKSSNPARKNGQVGNAPSRK